MQHKRRGRRRYRHSLAGAILSRIVPTKIALQMNETDMPTAMRVATTDGLGFGGAAKVAFARFHNRGGAFVTIVKLNQQWIMGASFGAGGFGRVFEAKNAADRSDRDVPAEGSDNARAGLQGKILSINSACSNKERSCWI
jgi:hypothetical protein